MELVPIKPRVRDTYMEPTHKNNNKQTIIIKHLMRQKRRYIRKRETFINKV